MPRKRPERPKVRSCCSRPLAAREALQQRQLGTPHDYLRKNLPAPSSRIDPPTSKVSRPWSPEPLRIQHLYIALALRRKQHRPNPVPRPPVRRIGPKTPSRLISFGDVRLAQPRSSRQHAVKGGSIVQGSAGCCCPVPPRPRFQQRHLGAPGRTPSQDSAGLFLARCTPPSSRQSRTLGSRH